MKRILLACSLFIAAGSAAFAQSAPSHPAPPVVSKSEFTARLGELDALMAANNKDGADAKFHELSMMINSEMTVIRYKLQDATETHDEAGKTQYLNLAKTQRGIYAEVMQLKSDWAANKAIIHTKLATFADSII